MSNSHFTAVGNIATEPEPHVFKSGSFKCSFRLAVNERKRDRETGKWFDAATSYFTVNTYRSLGEHAYASLQKGDRIFVSGRLQVKRWEKEDKSGHNVEIDADAVGHDLKFGSTTYARQSTRPESAFEPKDEEFRTFGTLTDRDTITVSNIREEVRGQRSEQAA